VLGVLRRDASNSVFLCNCALNLLLVLASCLSCKDQGYVSTQNIEKVPYLTLPWFFIIPVGGYWRRMVVACGLAWVFNIISVLQKLGMFVVLFKVIPLFGLYFS